MRIKFLSLIASFLMVSFVITSCFDNENNIEYSPDATIHAFSLDTVGYGITYKFTIDQLSCEIYNEDSLPVHADTIIDRILITNLSTASGFISMKDKSGNDSLINTADSIDLRNPIKIKVWSTEAISGVSPNQTKEYTISVRVHKHDPDSLKWTYAGNINNELTGAQTSVALGNEILTYSVVGGALKVYRAQKGNAMTWASNTVSGTAFNNELPTSILAFEGKLYATSSTEDGIVYESTDGTTWAASDLFSGEDVNLLLAPLNQGVYYIKTVDGERVFYSTIQAKSIAAVMPQVVPDDFPTANLSYTPYTTSTGIEAVMLVGQYETQPVVGEDTPTTVPWGCMGGMWSPLPPNNVETACPALPHPSIIYYNERFYIFGEGFNSFYVSTAGIAWAKAPRKFYFPYQDWNESAFAPSTEQPEFRGRTTYSTVVDNDTKNVYILFSKGEANFEAQAEEAGAPTRQHNYSYGAEAWSFRLNQLWFDLANAGL